MLAGTYLRALRLLGPRAWLAAGLTIANVLLAAAQFAEPVLFGRVIDALTHARATARGGLWPRLWALLAAWVGFGLFNIVAGALVALFADRLSHRQRLAVLADHFEHVLSLPLAHHGDVHSGRLMKIMVMPSIRRADRSRSTASTSVG